MKTAVRVAGIVLLATAVVTFACTQQPQVAQEPPPRALELHLADYCERPMANRLHFQRYSNEMPLCAERTSQLDERDFSSASLGNDNIGAPALNLCFSRSGRDKFERLVSSNVGRWIVFTTHGKLLMGAKIMSADVPNCAMVQGHVNAEDASALQRVINGR
jgi:preprotein translocase subunit SecD